ncbi:MAG: 3-isopropylmalate dehydratase, partial [Deltaproteobacteria bacterium]|nr:3-isopropylmalate dehydratase [Deltaproteobacteria bacterium]
MNLIEKYLARAAGLEHLSVGQDIRCRVNMAAAHDVTGLMAFRQFEE